MTSVLASEPLCYGFNFMSWPRKIYFEPDLAGFFSIPTFIIFSLFLTDFFPHWVMVKCLLYLLFRVCNILFPIAVESLSSHPKNQFIWWFDTANYGPSKILDFFLPIHKQVEIQYRGLAGETFYTLIFLLRGIYFFLTTPHSAFVYFFYTPCSPLPAPLIPVLVIFCGSTYWCIISVWAKNIRISSIPFPY